MDSIESYITSGKIEAYCLGLSSPSEEKEILTLCSIYHELEEHLSACQSAFEYYLHSFQIPLPEKLETSISDLISTNENFQNIYISPEGKLSDFVDISKKIPVESYIDKLKTLKPPSEYDNIHLMNIYNDGKREINLVWVKEGVPLEKHPDLEESFLILEGTADCYIDGEKNSMVAGDYMMIPPLSSHEVKITSDSPAMAIQYRSIAA